MCNSRTYTLLLYSFTLNTQAHFYCQTSYCRNSNSKTIESFLFETSLLMLANTKGKHKNTPFHSIK